MGVVSKRSRDRLLMAGAAAVFAVAFYFAWKALRSTAALDDENEDGEKELQDLEQLMQTNEEKGAEAACVNSYSEKEQDGFTVEEFEQFVAEEYGKPQAEVTVDPPSNLIEEEEFAVEDFIRTEEDQHGDSRGKFEDSGIPCDGFLEGTHLCLTSPSDEIERFSMENDLQEDNHSVNLNRSGPCIGHDVCDSGLTETIHGISNGISDDSNPLFGDFEGFSSSNTGTPLGQVKFDISSNSSATQGIPSEDFVTEFCSSRDAELSTQKVVIFLGNGVQACDLKNQPDGQNASEFHQTSIDDKGTRLSCEGPVTELSDFKDVGELAGHLSDDGQHHNHKVAVSEEPSDVGIALEHEFHSSVNKGMESLGPQEGLDTESSNSSNDDACNEHSSDNDSESSTVENCEHADRETTTVYSEKPLDESERHLLDDSLKSLSIKNRDHVGYQIAADSEKSFDGQIVLQAELGNISKNEKMGDLNSVAPLSEVSYSAHNGCDELSSHLLEDGIPS